MGNFPKFMHHATKPPVRVHSVQQQLELGAEWSERYIHQAYPKWKYHWNKPAQIVSNSDEEARLGGGWADTPAAFEPYRDPTRARPKQPDLFRWVADWVVPGLSPRDREKIKAQLLKADAAFWKAPDGPSSAADSMKFAFNGIAKVLFDSGQSSSWNPIYRHSCGTPRSLGAGGISLRKNVKTSFPSRSGIIGFGLRRAKKGRSYSEQRLRIGKERCWKLPPREAVLENPGLQACTAQHLLMARSSATRLSAEVLRVSRPRNC